MPLSGQRDICDTSRVDRFQPLSGGTTWAIMQRPRCRRKATGSGVGLKVAISALLLMAACTNSPKSATPPSPTVTNSPSPTFPGGINDALLGNYLDGPVGTPHYVLDVRTSTATHFSGWLYFEYQDGRIAPLFHYTATTGSGDALSVQTDSSSVPFSIGAGGPVPLATGGQAGSSPLPLSQTYAGVDDGTSITITDCGSFLYWASPHPGTGPAQSCTFTHEAGA